MELLPEHIANNTEVAAGQHIAILSVLAHGQNNMFVSTRNSYSSHIIQTPCPSVSGGIVTLGSVELPKLAPTAGSAAA
jgi:hypothetical protein